MLRAICAEPQATGYGRLAETLPPDRARRLEDVNTLWAEILSKPSPVIADLINIVDRALTLNRNPELSPGRVCAPGRTR
jgi:hypothetical protein